MPEKTKPLRKRAATVLKSTANAVLAPFDLTLARVRRGQACTLDWVAESERQGMAVNDFIEKDQRKPALDELQRLVYPRIAPDSTVCELGPGTGVYTRHLNEYLGGGQLHVVDSDPDAIDFLRRHLPKKPGTRLYRNSGTELPLDTDGGIDLVFCASMFTGGNLSYFHRYTQEFARVLRPGGHCVFDYFDIATDAGWGVLTRNMARERPIFAYTYHTADTVDRVLRLHGLEPVERFGTIRGSVFVVARKP